MVGLPGVSAVGTAAAIRRALALWLDDANFVPFARVSGSHYAAGPGASAIDPRRSRQLATAAQFAFFGQPRPLVRLAHDLVSEPRTLPNLARKAVEMVRHGGPVPVRDQP
jgi:hypothetical protein